MLPQKSESYNAPAPRSSARRKMSCKGPLTIRTSPKKAWGSGLGTADAGKTRTLTPTPHLLGRTTKLTCPARVGELRTPRTDVAGRVRCSAWFGRPDLARVEGVQG